MIKVMAAKSRCWGKNPVKKSFKLAKKTPSSEPKSLPNSSQRQECHVATVLDENVLH